MNDEDYRYVRVKYTMAIMLIIVATLGMLLVLTEIQDVLESKPGSWYFYCSNDSCSCNVYGSVPLQQAVLCMDFMNRYYWKENSPPIITEISGEVN